MSGQAHATRAHALLGASKASQWMNCPPSARLQDQVDDKRSSYAEEGTLAHELAEIKLNCRTIHPQQLDSKGVEVALAKVKNNPYYSTEMEEMTERYVDIVLERYAEAQAVSADAQIMLEERLDFSEWVPEGYGTGDVIIVADGTMWVIDLKYGKGVPVSAVGNAQMRLYALGALSTIDYLYNIEDVRMTIVQPRLDSVSEDVISVDELLDWAENSVRPAAQLAFAGEGAFKAGEHCRWCKVKATCRARADENMKALAYEFKEPALLSLDEVSAILHIAEQLGTWAKDVSSYAFDQAKQGKTIPSWKLVEGRSNRTITDKEAAINILANADFEGKQFLKPVELLGISELEKRVGKKELKTLIGHLIEKPSGKPVLVPETDKRPALNSIEQDFANIEMEVM